MSIKLGRNYRLTIGVTPDSNVGIQISFPTTVEFDFVRNTSSRLNEINLRIYNLSLDTRSQIVKNRYDMQDNGSLQSYRKVIFEAGYDDLLSTVFVGDLSEAYSYRNGPDIITYVNAFDGAYALSNSYSSTSFGRGISFKEMAETLIKDLVNTNKGAVGEISGESKRGTVLNGNTFTLLNGSFNNTFFFDLGNINMLNPNEVLNFNAGLVPIISSETGLLGTPKWRNTTLSVDMIFEPRLNVGQVVEIRSTTDPRFDGQYKITGLQGNGIISGAVGGDCKTSLELFAGDALFGGLKTVNY